MFCVGAHVCVGVFRSKAVYICNQSTNSCDQRCLWCWQGFILLDKTYTNTLVFPNTAMIALLFLQFAGLQVSECTTVTPMGVTKWKMTLHTRDVAVDRVSALVTGGEAARDGGVQFLLCLVRLYLLGVQCYPGSCLLISGQWQGKHSAGTDKLVCRFSYFLGADMCVDAPSVQGALNKLYKSIIIRFDIKTSCPCLCRASKLVLC